MHEYSYYNFDILEKDIIKTLKEAENSGYTPLIYINGMFYNVILEKEDNKTW